MSVFRPKTSAFKLAGDGSRAPLCRRAIVGLVEHALERLAALRLIRRAGDAVHLFYYDQEEFAFRDGRLLLRGNNGTGKSKVLALTLPFLFDGELAAYRVEPDADAGKRMEWNLLLGGEHPNDERIGYAWLELGRLGEDGAAFCTIGCGIKAVKGRGIAAHWFFVCDQRVGEDLALVDATGVALTADRLEDVTRAPGSVPRARVTHAQSAPTSTRRASCCSPTP